MLYDLNIAWSPAQPADRLRQTLRFARSLGYATVALNHTLELPFPAKPTSPFPAIVDEPPSEAPSPQLPQILHRATAPLADPSASKYRLPALAAVYDILAVRPLTEKAFQNACLTLDVPLISLDLTTYFPFHFKPKPCMAAVARGVRFEICYSQLFTADTRGRASFISNVTSLVRATRGRGLLLSSEAKSQLNLRGPADVVNLLSVWGLASEKGLEGFRSIPRSVVVNEGMKRTGFRGVINVVQTAKKDSANIAENDSAAKIDSEDSAQLTRSQKRKHAEGGGGGGDNSVEGRDSKGRKGRKMRIAAQGHSASRNKTT